MQCDALYVGRRVTVAPRVKLKMKHM